MFSAVRRCSLAAVTVLALTFALPAAHAATAPEHVSYKSGDETVKAELYLPQGKGPFPALVVIHEWWGVTDWVRQQGETFAANGYASLVIDLYRGHTAHDPEEAHELMRGVPQDRAMRDLKAAVTYLQTRSDIKKDRIGDVGWCMGGGYALQLAASNPSIRAVAANYGPPPTDPSALKAMPTAVLGNYGALDRGITPDDVHAFENTLKADGKNPDVKIYPDAGHAFENPDNKDGYKPQDAADAQARTLAFLQRNLKQ